MSSSTALKAADLRYNASLSYRTSLDTLRALPRSTALEFADRIYAEMHMAYQLQRQAEKHMEEK